MNKRRVVAGSGNRGRRPSLNSGSHTAGSKVAMFQAAKARAATTRAKSQAQNRKSAGGSGG